MGLSWSDMLTRIYATLALVEMLGGCTVCHCSPELADAQHLGHTPGNATLGGVVLSQ